MAAEKAMIKLTPSCSAKVSAACMRQHSAEYETDDPAYSELLHRQGEVHSILMQIILVKLVRIDLDLRT